MTINFNKTSLPWKLIKSKFIGFSSMCYMIPAFLLNGSTFILIMIKIIWIFQAIVSYYSDYIYSGITHISHGIDRWVSSILVFIMIIIATIIINPIEYLLFLIPIFFLQMGKYCAKNNKWNGYVFYHTGWHIIGP